MDCGPRDRETMTRVGNSSMSCEGVQFIIRNQNVHSNIDVGMNCGLFHWMVSWCNCYCRLLIKTKNPINCIVKLLHAMGKLLIKSLHYMRAGATNDHQLALNLCN